MKLFGWMHRKFRQNSGEPYRDFNCAGNPCNGITGRQSLEEARHQYYSYQKPARVPLRPIIDDQFIFLEREAPKDMEEVFHGLLAIGTLGSLGQVEEEDQAAGAATPTFGVPALPPVSVEAIMEKEEEYETTEDDLMIINAELEKVLIAPEAEKGDRLSSARASHVSAKQLVVSSCPLQEYLFGSLVDATEAAVPAPVAEKKEHHRTSLGELFQRTRMVEERGKKEEREKSTAGMQLMVKKMLKRRGPNGSSRSATCNLADHGALEGDGGSGQPGSETKFHKIMQMFHRKVHPENPVAEKKMAKASKSRRNSSDGVREFCGKGLIAAGANSLLMRKEGEPCRKRDDNGGIHGGGDSNGNKEHWIKTDAEYLVLEL